MIELVVAESFKNYRNMKKNNNLTDGEIGFQLKYPRKVMQVIATVEELFCGTVMKNEKIKERFWFFPLIASAQPFQFRR